MIQTNEEIIQKYLIKEIRQFRRRRKRNERKQKRKDKRAREVLEVDKGNKHEQMPHKEEDTNGHNKL